MIEIRVIGTPGPQGSKRFVGHRGGKGIMVESSAKVKPWREAVKWAAREALGGPLVGPVSAEMIFTLQKPKSAPKTRRTYPDRKPDLSKLIRSTEDALTDSGIWEDDARCIRISASKVFPGEHVDALDVPGVLIRLRAVVMEVA